MPGVVVEILYLSNQDDVSLLSKEGFLDSVSQAICNAILRFASTIR
jgi:N-acetylmuramoyl-L-alanine amidase